jgi:hypothetical protein
MGVYFGVPIRDCNPPAGARTPVRTLAAHLPSAESFVIAAAAQSVITVS